MTPELSVVIPALNEAATLPELLRALAAQREIPVEPIVADGGSSDGTRELAAATGVRVIPAARGRARQMNAAAREASGEFLLLLHADSRIEDPALLAGAVRALRTAIAQRGHDRIAGHFRLRFDRRTGGHDLAWRYVEEKTAFNRPYTTNGDQGLLLTRRYFEALGGFDERLPFLEDQRLAARIRASGELMTLPGLLHTSARRFERAGFHRQYLLMAVIMAAHAAGLDDFFARAPDLYRAQHESGRLLLTPFFRLLRGILRERSAGEALRTWLAVGRLGRENGWQLSYFLDVALRPWLGPGRYPCLRLFERVLEPLTRNRVFDGFAALVLAAHFHLVLCPLYRVLEHPALRAIEPV